jgi:hypothetical protein
VAGQRQPGELLRRKCVPGELLFGQCLSCELLCRQRVYGKPMCGKWMLVQRVWGLSVPWSHPVH